MISTSYYTLNDNYAITKCLVVLDVKSNTSQRKNL